jgi:hypothetical protein
VESVNALGNKIVGELKAAETKEGDWILKFLCLITYANF